MSFFDGLEFLYPGEFGDTIVNTVKLHALESLDNDFCIGCQFGITNDPLFNKKIKSGFLNSYINGLKRGESVEGNSGIDESTGLENSEVSSEAKRISKESKYQDANGVIQEPIMKFDLGAVIIREVLIMEARDIERRGDGNGFSTSIFSNPTIVACCDLIKYELIRKDNFLVNLSEHYKNIKRKNEFVSSFCVSFGLKPSVKISSLSKQYSVSAHLERLGNALKKFFNLVRNRASFNYIVGYFWVVMIDAEGIPYIHLNFYVNNDRFGQRLAEDINGVWLKVTNGAGEIIHYSHRLKFNLLGMTNIFIGRLGLDYSIFWKIDKETHRILIKKISGSKETSTWENPEYLFDLNGKRSTKIKHLANAQIKELFISYLRCIAMEAFHYPGKRMFGLSKIREKKIKLGAFPKNV